MLKVMQDEIISHELSSWKSQDFEEVWMTKAAHLLVINKQKCNVEVVLWEGPEFTSWKIAKEKIMNSGELTNEDMLDLE